MVGDEFTAAWELTFSGGPESSSARQNHRPVQLRIETQSKLMVARFETYRRDGVLVSKYPVWEPRTSGRTMSWWATAL